MRAFRKLLVHSATPADGACWTAAKRAEYDIYAERNGWSDDASRTAGEDVDYLPYEGRSEILVVTPADDVTKAIGVTRMIWGVADLPLEEQFVVMDVHEIDPEWRWMLDHIGGPRLAEWATLGAVGATLSPMFALWAAAYDASRRRGVDYWVQTVVDEIFGVYRDGFKAPMMRIGPRRDYDGTACTPTVLSLEEIGIGNMLAWNPSLKRALFDGWVERRPVPPRSTPTAITER